ncbi:MAG: hypothetical protein HYR70_14185 [Chloroflexi bacterium]|nr:hypothetical protein [Chloroflexota bacterium]MBI3339781.1 hypothetical protein [Chloroflexota bacterium]
MDKKFNLSFVIFILVSMTLGACAFANTFNTSPASVPTSTAIPSDPTPTQGSIQDNSTATSAPTNMPAPALGPSQPPAGYTWQGVPGVSPAFLVPDGWYFTTETDPGFNSYYATKEKDASGNNWFFSTGLAVSAIDSDRSDIANVTFAKQNIDKHASKSTTKRVINSSQNEQGNLASYEILIEAEYTDVAQDNPNRKKNVFYRNIFDKKINILYVISFESPTSTWDAEWQKGKPMIDAFTQQLTTQSEQPAQNLFSNLANTTLTNVALPNIDRPTGMQGAAKSKLLATTGGGFIQKAPSTGSPWQEAYSLDIQATGALPPNAVLETTFENPLDATSPIVVRLYRIPSGSIHLESPYLSGFKCQNYWVTVKVYSDAGQTQELDSYVQWINSVADLSKVTDITDFITGATCY